MRIAYLTHSLESCWNHGNAHFLRGVLRELKLRGHEVEALEPEHSWSLTNLLDDHGPDGLEPYRQAYPELASRTYKRGADFEPMLDGADLVIVHEWNEPDLIAAIGRLRIRSGTFTLLFHDSLHRAASDPAAMKAIDLTGYDGVLAIGDALADLYRRSGWGERAFVWREAADISHFRPPAEEGPREGLVWIGNWGDSERAKELESCLLEPARDAGLALDLYGVRYPEAALAMLDRYGARYRGWLPSARIPEIFARHLATVHVPRRFDAIALPGIPTIRMFEALACGIPLVSAPWQDSDGLFRAGQDYLSARDGAGMTRELERLQGDPALRCSLARSGLETIRARHTCGHRADELLAIVAGLNAPGELKSVA
jgi:spore maturation protein CgeB